MIDVQKGEGETVANAEAEARLDNSYSNLRGSRVTPPPPDPGLSQGEQ